MILYSNAFNSAGERVRIALALKNIAYEYVSIQDFGWAEYAKHHAVIAASPEQQSDYARAYEKIWVRSRDGSGPIATKSQMI